MNKIIIWLVIILVFIISRFIKFESEGFYEIAMLSIVYFMNNKYMVVPFITGGVMEFPSGALTLIKKEDDILRYITFTMALVFNVVCIILI